MHTLAPDVHQLRGWPLNTINVYLVASILVDAGTPAARRRILHQLRGRDVSAQVVTHAHPDHLGYSHAVCETLGLPLWTGERDAEAVETASPVPARGRLPALLARMMPPRVTHGRAAFPGAHQMQMTAGRCRPGHLDLSRRLPSVVVRDPS